MSYLRVVLSGASSGLSASLIDPHGEKLVLFTGSSSFIPLSFIAQAEGIYTLICQPLNEQEDTTFYKIELEALRATNMQDASMILADQWFLEGQRLYATWQAESLKQALRQYERASSLWRKAHKEKDVAVALRSSGQAYTALGNNKAALDYYLQALALSQNCGDKSLEAGILNDASLTYIDLGDQKKSFEMSSKAATLSKDLGDSVEEARSLTNIGLYHYVLSDLLKAVEVLNRALTMSREMGDRKGQAQSLINLGYAYQDLGEMDKALSCYTQALALWRAVSDRRGEAFALNATGNIFAFRGEKQESLNLQNRALQLFRTLGDLNGEASVMNGIGYVYDDLGEKLQALDFYNQSLQCSRATGNRGFECLTIGYIGRIYRDLGDKQKALKCFKQRLVLSRILDDRRVEGYTLRDIGSIFESSGEKGAALLYYQRALVQNRLAEDRRGQAYSLNSLGHLYLASGKKRKSLSAYEMALSLIRAAGDRPGEVLSLYNLAQAQRSLGNLSQAREQIESALNIIESLRTKVAAPELRASYFASTHQCYEVYIDLLMQMHKESPELGLSACALSASERARARSLLDTLIESHADIRQGVTPTLLDSERSLQRLLNAKYDLQMQLLSSERTQKYAEGVAEEIRALTVKLQDIQAQIREESSSYALLKYPQPLTLAEIQNDLLDEDTVLLEYSLGDENSYVWEVGKTSFANYRLPPRRIIEALARSFYDTISSSQPRENEGSMTYDKRKARAARQFFQQSTRLSQILLGPLGSTINGKRLVIVAEGMLQYLPFSSLSALEVGQDDSMKAGKLATEFVPLILQHEIVSLPSASALTVLRKQSRTRSSATRTVAVFADPVFEKDDVRVSTSGREAAPADVAPAVAGLRRALRDIGVTKDGLNIPRLPATRKEAGAILAIAPPGSALSVTDFEANLTKLADPTLSQYRIIHIATHGLFDNDHPNLSGIVFSLVDEQGHAQEGFLHLQDIYNLNLPVELVVLSACNTALGKDVRGDGLVGVARGFMHAGALRVIASLWRVDDMATATLMRYFYQGVLVEGLPAAAALRKAQIEMWKHPHWKPPFYWAAFGLQGDWQ